MCEKPCSCHEMFHCAALMFHVVQSLKDTKSQRKAEPLKKGLQHSTMSDWLQHLLHFPSLYFEPEIIMIVNIKPFYSIFFFLVVSIMWS